MKPFVHLFLVASHLTRVAFNSRKINKTNELKQMKPYMNMATKWWLMIGPLAANQIEGYDLEKLITKGYKQMPR